MQSLIPNPLHPAVVHLPVALAVLLPFFTLGALWLIRRGSPARTTWSLLVGVVGMLVISAMVAKQTGEQQEDRVEQVVPEQAIHGHEEGAELFIVVAAGVLALALAGLAGGRIGQAARVATAVGTLGILGAGWNVGHSGGMLVYRDGAASAYAGPASPNTPSSGERGEEGHERRSGDGR